MKVAIVAGLLIAVLQLPPRITIDAFTCRRLLALDAEPQQ